MRKVKNNTYVNGNASEAFREYSLSTDAKIEQELLFQGMEKFLPEKRGSRVLDAACGTGWLSQKLFEIGYDVSACDISSNLISNLQEKTSQIKTEVCDLCQKTPFESEIFDQIIINMSLHDFQNPGKALKNLRLVLSDQGKMLVTVANPYYSYPVGRWKRGFWKKIINKRPFLRLFPYNYLITRERRHFWRGEIPSYFYTLPEYFDAALDCGLKLERFLEISSEADSKFFDRRYQLYRFPMLLLMVFQKK